MIIPGLQLRSEGTHRCPVQIQFLHGRLAFFRHCGLLSCVNRRGKSYQSHYPNSHHQHVIAPSMLTVRRTVDLPHQPP